MSYQSLHQDIGHELIQHRRGMFNTLQGQTEYGEEDNAQISELVKEKQALEKQLDQALVNNEVTEASSALLHQNLHSTHQTIARLLADNAKYINIETRLSKAIDE
ncbi:hypothetical protein EV360DRAFT_90480 [Lentinula raphanica]|nr:hypothetical protein EV360DRAFT_90480 [Lentinula raphanica]